MMRGKITVIILASVVIYVLLCSTLFFTTPFMVTWGEAKPWYLQIMIFAQDFPFSLIRGDGEVMMSLIFVNALFWTLFLAGMFWLLAVKFFKEKKSQA